MVDDNFKNIFDLFSSQTAFNFFRINKLPNVLFIEKRKQIDGLSAIIQQNFKIDLFSNSVFLFCGRNTRTMMALYWESDGFVLLYKRLENG
ncbi:IS66 family insertion sequence element accessory protein TnpB [Thomasclavelia ramosa]|uniref:IS66 family insertion sequence element accessory protein TnpB n=1 Tax=Thomasclavelia ramosa TaxID=1547 RepID=UPI000E3FD708|nr:transposase [Thomasclavelia ramosa]